VFDLGIFLGILRIMKQNFELSFYPEMPDDQGDIMTKECLQSIIDSAEGVQIFVKNAFHGLEVGLITSARKETDSIVKFEAEMSDEFNLDINKYHLGYTLAMRKFTKEKEGHRIEDARLFAVTIEMPREINSETARKFINITNMLYPPYLTLL
jgi:hypothetical protein